MVKRGGDDDDWEPDDRPPRDESAARSHQPCVRRMATADGCKKGAIRISAMMANTEWAHTRAAATHRLRQCAQTAVCRHRRVPPLPSAAPAAKRPHAQAARAHSELRLYAWRSDGEHFSRRRSMRRHWEWLIGGMADCERTARSGSSRGAVCEKSRIRTCVAG